MENVVGRGIITPGDNRPRVSRRQTGGTAEGDINKGVLRAGTGAPFENGRGHIPAPGQFIFDFIDNEIKQLAGDIIAIGGAKCAKYWCDLRL